MSIKKMSMTSIKVKRWSNQVQCISETELFSTNVTEDSKVTIENCHVLIDFVNFTSAVILFLSFYNYLSTERNFC